MNLLVNKGVKKFFIILIFILFAAMILLQMIAYTNADHFKKDMILHDYKIAGYLLERHSEMAAEIQSAFTADHSVIDVQSGRKLLEQSGYKNSIQLNLMPAVNTFYKNSRFNSFILSVILSMMIVFMAYIFLAAHYKKIDQHCEDVCKIMNGETGNRLEDSGEGSVPKLASSINMLTSSLNTHIEKEKQSRLFLKDVIANVSHQLKTPLSALMMYNEIIKDEHMDNEVVVDFLNKSENELERMQTLISNLFTIHLPKLTNQ